MKDSCKVWNWDQTFMTMVYVISKRSRDPNTQVGAVIVNPQNIIVGMGFNGFPRGIADEDWPWARPEKYLAVVHAEVNAVLNSNQSDLRDGRIYMPFFSCNECAKVVIQAGIKEVIYHTKYLYDTEPMYVARQLYDLAGVCYRQFKFRPLSPWESE